jgi:hypothetical protein
MKTRPVLLAASIASLMVGAPPTAEATIHQWIADYDHNTFWTFSDNWHSVPDGSR